MGDTAWDAQKGRGGKIQPLRASATIPGVLHSLCTLWEPSRVTLPAAASARCNPHGKKSLWSRFWETPRAVGAAGVTEVTPWWHRPTAWSQGGTSRWDGQTQIKIKALCRKAPRNVLQPLIGFPSPFPPHGDEYSSRTGTGTLPKVGYQVWAGLG